MLRILLFVILLTSWSISFSQDQLEVLPYSDLIEQISKLDTSKTLVVKNKLIVGKHGEAVSLEALEKDSLGYYVINNRLEFHDCVFEIVEFDSVTINQGIYFSNTPPPAFSNSIIRELSLTGSSGKPEDFKALNVRNCSIDRFSLIIGYATNVNISYSRIRSFFLQDFEVSNTLSIHSSEIDLFRYDSKANGSLLISETKFTNSLVLDPAHEIISGSYSAQGVTTGVSISFTNGRILGLNASTFESTVELNLSGVNRFFCNENKSDSLLVLMTVDVPELTITKNSFHLINLTLADLFDKNLVIDWEDINGKMGIFSQGITIPADSAFTKKSTYNSINRTVGHIYQAYKNNQNLEDANAAYVWLKNFQGKKYAYDYQNDPDFKKLIRWKLNSLMRVYTEYGTSPATAIFWSINIILYFSIFYFFFPSEWDKESKPKLIRNFREFIANNDKGYFKPFMHLLTGLVLSLFNAVMLSLNAFVTLGFGSIPTKGIARYVCILQGFIGWFLLSIFTVAMINQFLS